MPADLEVVREERGGGEIETQKLAKALGEFNLPNEISQLIGWTQDRFEDGVRGFFLAGLGLIKLHMTTTNTYSVILEQNFPGLNQRVAENYMAVTKATINHPAFQAFQKERGGYSKMLTALNLCSEAQLNAADETGILCGYEVDQLAKMSVRTMQKALLNAREHERVAVRQATEGLSEKLTAALAENEDLKVQIKAVETPADAAFALVKQAETKLLAAFQMLNKVPKELLVESPALRDVLYGLCGLVDRVMKNQEWRADQANIERLAREQEASDDG